MKGIRCTDAFVQLYKDDRSFSCLSVTLSSVWCNYVATNAVVRCRTVRWLAVTTSSAQSSGSTSTASASPTSRRANGSVLDVAALGRLLWIPTCWPSSRNDLNDRRRRSVILTRWLPVTDEARVLLFSLYARAIDKTVASCRPPCSNSTVYFVIVVGFLFPTMLRDTVLRSLDCLSMHITSGRVVYTLVWNFHGLSMLRLYEND